MKLIFIEIKKLLFTKVSILLLLFVLCISVLIPALEVGQYNHNNAAIEHMSVAQIAEKIHQDQSFDLDQPNLQALTDKDPYPSNVPDASIEYIPGDFSAVLSAIGYRETGQAQEYMLSGLIEKPNEVISTNKLNSTLNDLQTSGLENGYAYHNYKNQLGMMEKSRKS